MAIPPTYSGVVDYAVQLATQAAQGYVADAEAAAALATSNGAAQVALAADEADRAEAAADEAAASAAASVDTNRLTNAIALLGQAALADANNLTTPNRQGTSGEMVDFNPATSEYLFGLFNGPSSMLKCVRASSGDAIGGGSSQSFAVNVPRIHGGKILKDAGGTNVVPDPTDYTVAGWTKTNLGTPTLTSGLGGANGAYALRETTTTGLHQLTRNITGVTAFTQITVHFLVKAVGRDFVNFGFFNASTSKNTVARASFLTGAILSSYPAQTGGQTAIDAGIHDYGDGWWLLWITGTFSATETGFRPYINTMSNSTTTSFAGDTAKGLDVAGVWAVTGVALPVNFLTTSRSAETLTLPLIPGAYIERASDGTTAVSSAFLLDEAQYRAPSFPTKAPWVTRYQLWRADLYDAMDRSDTTNGDLGTASDGGTYTLFNGYVSSYPLPTATTGRVEGGWVKITPASGSTGTVYAVRDLGAGLGAKYASMSVRFGAAVSGGGALSNTSVTILFSADINELVDDMPVHMVLTRSALTIQKRVAGGAFVTLGQIGARLLPNNAEHTVTIAIHGTLARITLNGNEVVISDAGFATACRYVCWEIQTTSNNTTDLGQFRNSIASTALVGDPPSYSAAAPVVTLAAATTPSSPASFTSGCTLSVSPSPAAVTSNNGAVSITGYQWYRNGVAISGATSATHVTTAGIDAGATFYCAITYTNTTGSTVGNSVVTSALA